MAPANILPSGACAPSASSSPSGAHGFGDVHHSDQAALQRRIVELEALLAHHDAVARRLRLQHAIAEILASARTIDHALPLVLGTIAEAEQWDVAIAWVLDEGLLSQRYDWCRVGVDASSFLAQSREWRFERDEGLPGRAMKDGKLVWTSDFSSELQFPRAQAAASAQLRSAAAFPLRCGDAVYGVIELLGTRSGELDENTCDVYEALRGDIGRFIEARQYEARLRRKNARLAEAQRIAQLAHWEWIPATGKLRNNEGSTQVLGLGLLELPETLDEYLALVPAEERDKLQTAFAAATDPDVRTLEVEHTLRHIDGTESIVIVRAETEFNQDGELSRVSGTVQDVTERRLASAQALAMEKRWEAIFRNSPLPGLVTDAETGECLAANEEMLEWLGLAEDEVVGHTTVELKIWSSAYLREEIVCRMHERGCLRHFETHTQMQGELRNVQINVEYVELHGRSCFLVQFVDITARKRLETTLRLTASAVEQAAEAMVILDAEGVILTVNPAFTNVTGYASNEAVGQTLDQLLHRPTDRYDELFFRRLAGSLVMHGHWEGEVWARRKSGEIFPELLSLSAIRNEHDEVVNHIAVFNDISDRKDYENRLKMLALHDGLTGLPNRSLLTEHLRQALASARRESTQVAVLFTDLDRFKSVNDIHGHETGDELLRHVAARLKGCVRASDLVARLGGDEFVIVLPDVASQHDAAHVADKIVTAMAEPFAIDHARVEVGASVGIALYPEHGDDARVLLRRADEALYRAKKTGRNGYELWG